MKEMGDVKDDKNLMYLIVEQIEVLHRQHKKEDARPDFILNKSSFE
jgi:hypothetical protein